jgi:hypothetical protein
VGEETANALLPAAAIAASTDDTVGERRIYLHNEVTQSCDHQERDISCTYAPHVPFSAIMSTVQSCALDWTR